MLVPDDTQIHVSVTRPILSTPGSSTINMLGTVGGHTIDAPPSQVVFSLSFTLIQAENLIEQLMGACQMALEEEEEEDDQRHY